MTNIYVIYKKLNKIYTLNMNKDLVKIYSNNKKNHNIIIKLFKKKNKMNNVFTNVKFIKKKKHIDLYPIDKKMIKKIKNVLKCYDLVI